ncbi:unnamed protein product [Mytilus edulis]|uniref:Uncharacterized protein n=1 Tax=Mytilus edulis TaxID=6550 RepID=A0A8S3QQ45_MYTED|nr:unnamed protein product [Mytilus edulis]
MTFILITMVLGNIIDISKYGTFRKLIRVTAYVQRFISNCRFTKHLRKSGVLTTNDINTAVRSWILDCQKSSYSAEIKSLQDTRNKNTMKYPRIRQLGLFIDDDGLRCAHILLLGLFTVFVEGKVSVGKMNSYIQSLQIVSKTAEELYESLKDEKDVTAPEPEMKSRQDNIRKCADAIKPGIRFIAALKKPA